MAASRSSFVTLAAVAAAVVAGLARSSEAALTYTYYDLGSPSQVDVSFTVATQLTTTGQVESASNVTGAYASYFPAGSTAECLQGPPGYQPVIDLNNSTGSNFLDTTYTEFPYENVSNGVPGNGNHPVSGAIYQFVGEDLNVVTRLGSNTITGAPEPASTGLLAVGAVSLVTRRRRRV